MTGKQCPAEGRGVETYVYIRIPRMLETSTPMGTAGVMREKRWTESEKAGRPERITQNL